MISHRCDHCRKKLNPGEQCRCTARKQPALYSGEVKKLYDSARWEECRKQCRERFNGLDIVQLLINRAIVFGSVAHHIIPTINDEKLAYSQPNLIWLSENTHRLIHKLYEINSRDTQEFLKCLVSLYSRIISEGVCENVLLFSMVERAETFFSQNSKYNFCVEVLKNGTTKKTT